MLKFVLVICSNLQRMLLIKHQREEKEERIKTNRGGGIINFIYCPLYLRQMCMNQSCTKKHTCAGQLSMNKPRVYHLFLSVFCCSWASRYNQVLQT